MEKEFKPNKKKIKKFIKDVDAIIDICCEFRKEKNKHFGEISKCTCDYCDIQDECNLFWNAFKLMKKNSSVFIGNRRSEE